MSHIPPQQNRKKDRLTSNDAYENNTHAYESKNEQHVAETLTKKPLLHKTNENEETQNKEKNSIRPTKTKSLCLSFDKFSHDQNITKTLNRK